MRVPSFNMAFLPRFAGLDRDRFLAEQADIRPLRKHFYRRMGPTGFKKEDVEASLEQLGNTWARMDKALADGPWLLGARYSLADIVVAPLIDRMCGPWLRRTWEDEISAGRRMVRSASALVPPTVRLSIPDRGSRNSCPSPRPSRRS